MADAGGNTGGGRGLLILSGEASGDLHAGHLLTEIRSRCPEVEAFGIGGDELEAAGCRLLRRIDEMQVMGFVEVIGMLPRLRRIEAEILAECRRLRPAAAVLVDYPGFNLHIAPKLKAMGIAVIYYVSPQVWAWRRGRVKKMRGVVDLMMVLFDFEKEYYEVESVPVEWVGHPLVDSVDGWPSRSEARRELAAEEGEKVVAILPGSRPQELDKHLMVFADAARRISEGLGGTRARIVAAEAQSIAEGEILRRLGSDDVEVRRGDSPRVTRAADLVISASGTATLETALVGAPMVVCYRAGTLSYLLARLVVSIPYISLVNIVAGRGIVPELIQGDMTVERIAAEGIRLLSDPGLRAKQIEGLAEVAGKLGPPGASGRAAEKVVAFLAPSEDRPIH